MCIAAGCDVRCLIVDDSADFRDAASAMLERAGISVVKASNSAEALRYYEDLHPDVALVDIDLGGEDGFALAELLDRVSATSTTLAVILVSTYAESDLEEMINASPAVGFLQKFSLSPDAIRELAERHRASR